MLHSCSKNVVFSSFWHFGKMIVVFSLSIVFFSVPNSAQTDVIEYVDKDSLVVLNPSLVIILKELSVSCPLIWVLIIR